MPSVNITTHINLTAQRYFLVFLETFTKLLLRPIQTQCTLLSLSGLYFCNPFKETEPWNRNGTLLHHAEFVLSTVLLLLLSDHSLYRYMLFIFSRFNVSKNKSVLFCHFLVLKVYILVNSWRFAHLGKRHCSIILTLIKRRKYFWSLKENVLMVKVVVLMAVLFHLNNIKCNL